MEDSERLKEPIDSDYNVGTPREPQRLQRTAETHRSYRDSQKVREATEAQRSPKEVEQPSRDEKR